MTTNESKLDSSDDPEHNARVLSFREDVAKEDIHDVIQKHITTGDPVAIPVSTYFTLRLMIAKKFQLHPSSVILVGSCRTGFSLKPDKRYRPVGPDSDVDIAIVSSDLFDAYWDRVFDLARTDRGWAHTNTGKRFAKDLFSGWITPRTLPNLPRFSNGRAWAEFFDELTATRICGIREINARLYRSWERLEAYQEIMVTRCRDDLRKEK